MFEYSYTESETVMFDLRMPASVPAKAWVYDKEFETDLSCIRVGSDLYSHDWQYYYNDRI